MPLHTNAILVSFHFKNKKKSFVVLAADGSTARSILVFKTDQEKITTLDSHKLLATAVCIHSSRTSSSVLVVAVVVLVMVVT